MLLDVLDLFADFFELGFCGYDVVGDFGVVGFGADGVELAVELLAEKVEGAADGVGGGEEFGELLKVGGEAGELF